MSEERALGLLRALCAGLTPANIEVVADDKATAFSPRQNRIQIARRYLNSDTPAAIGALLHEVGHALVSRYDAFAVPKQLPFPRLWHLALNAVEEARVHSFLRLRLPGAGRYLEALFATDDVPSEASLESELMAFLAAAAVCDRYPSLPFLDRFPSAAAAFRLTADARSRYARTLPPGDLVARPGVAHRYAEAVAPLLTTIDARDVDPVEAEIVHAAAQAHRIFLAEIWPHVTELAERDAEHIGQSLQEDSELRAGAEHALRSAAGASVARRALQAWAEAHGGGTAAAVLQKIGELERLLFARYLEDAGSHRRFGGAAMPAAEPDASPADEGMPRAALSRRAARERQREAVTEPDPEALAAVLRAAVPRRRRHREGGYRSGLGLDLDRVMQAVASRRDPDRIWVRRMRESPALAALLLVDLSGSMANDGKVDAAIAATKSLSQALAAIRGVSWSVQGFQDKTFEFVGFEERADPVVLTRIGEMREEVAGTRASGNNQPRYNDDGPCLLEAAALLDARPERDRLLIVLSDGNPEGKNSGPDDLRAAIETIHAKPNTTLIGLGLGPATEHVERWYPISQANVAPANLAATLAGLLERSLHGLRLPR